MKFNKAENFLKSLKALDRKYRNKKLHIISDNLAIQKHKDVKKALAGNLKIQLNYTPTDALWLNHIEIWFIILAKEDAKGGYGNHTKSCLNS